MIKLSLNIPTYNRCRELEKNLGIIISQIREENYQRIIEINVSDNGSMDNTQAMVRNFCSNNPDIVINYHRIETNQGPDVNFITAMHMAKGEYSILYGDDDYLISGGLNKIMKLITSNSNIPVFLTNRRSINHDGIVLYDDYFLREDIESRVFDFSIEDQVRAYFALCNEGTLGGCLSFISSVIYKTSILHSLGDYNSSFTGTNYAFMFYWWPFLLKGNSLMYCRDTYVLSTTSGATNNNYGSGLRRILVDVKGISKVADLVFVGGVERYKYDFLAAANKCNSYAHIFNCFLRHRAMGYNELLPSLKSFGWRESKIDELKQTVSWRNLLIGVIGLFIRKRK